MKKFIAISVCLCWFCLIFYMSSKPGVESHKMSLSIVSAISDNQSVEKKLNDSNENRAQHKIPQANNNNAKLQPPSNSTGTGKNETVLNKNRSTTIKLDKSIDNKTKIMDKNESNSFNLDNFVRKNAHAFEYIVLAILVSSSFFAFNKKGKAYIIYILFICLFYAVTDEFHQSFVPGRTSLASDILIDFSGAIIGTTIFYLIYYKVIKKTRNVKQVY